MRRIRAAVLALIVSHAAFASSTASAPPAVHSRAQLEARLAAGPSPLDAFTAYGRRAFLQSLVWGEKGLGGMRTTELIRELNAEEIGAVLRLLDASAYMGMLVDATHGAPPLRLPAPRDDIERRVRALEQFHKEETTQRPDAAGSETTLGDAALAARYRAGFAATMQAQALAASPPGDLPLLFDAATLVAAASTDAQALRDMEAVHLELGRRHIDTRRGFDDAMLNALLAARRFDDARAFAAARPGMRHAPIPTVADTLGRGFRGRTVYDVDAASNRLIRSAAPAPIGAQVVMVVDAGCHFSLDALQAIATDAELLGRLRRASLLVIVPPRSPMSLAFIAEWNAAHPEMQIRVPLNAAEWSDVDVTGVPAFFVLRDGRVQQKLSGWPAQGRKAELLGALERLGQ